MKKVLDKLNAMPFKELLIVKKILCKVKESLRVEIKRHILCQVDACPN